MPAAGPAAIFGGAQPDASEAMCSLIKVQQGKRKITDYAIDFRTLCTQSDWNNVDLADAFFSRFF